MAMKMIHQFLGNVAWGELDYLLIDLPPGTGDVQLTLAQQAALTGAVIVTTPQDVALGIARKGLKMFQQVRVPILGIVENMSGFLCQRCGEKNLIFKEGGGRRMAGDLNVPFLGSIPLDAAIVESGDAGIPVLAKSKGTASAQAFLIVAEALKAQVQAARSAKGVEPQKLEMSPSGELRVLWSDGHQSRYRPYHLRVNCVCAACVNENTGVRMLDPKRVPLDIGIQGVQPVGRYGLSLSFSDRHDTGIYTFERLRALCECEACAGQKRAEPFAV
jgi:ATP-binding protein involved in chromosome partitioning